MIRRRWMWWKRRVATVRSPSARGRHRHNWRFFVCEIGENMKGLMMISSYSYIGLLTCAQVPSVGPVGANWLWAISFRWQTKQWFNRKSFQIQIFYWSWRGWGWALMSRRIDQTSPGKVSRESSKFLDRFTRGIHQSDLRVIWLISSRLFQVKTTAESSVVRSSKNVEPGGVGVDVQVRFSNCAVI